MKRLLSLIAIAVIYTSISGCHKDAPTQPANNSNLSLSRTSTADPTMAPGLADEFAVDLNPSVLNQETLSLWTANFTSRFQYSNSAYTTTQYQTVSVSSLLSVFNGMTSSGHTQYKFFRGLRMLYGATGEGAIKLYFVPCYADSTGNDSSGKRNFTVTPASTDLAAISGPVYTVIEGQLVDITDNLSMITDAKSSIQNYKSNIQIQAIASGSFRSYVTDVDANACFFPFQEIIALIEDNNATAIKFVSIGKNTEPDNIFRHDLAMVPTTYPATGSGQFTNLAADMGQLCPPRCDAVTYGAASF